MKILLPLAALASSIAFLLVTMQAAVFSYL
jgi:hypothetical protein